MNTQVIGRPSVPAASQPPLAPASRVAPAIRPSAPGRRRKSSRGLIVALVVVVGLPTLLASLYYGLIASPQYVSEASVTIRSSKQQASSLLENLVVAQDGIAGATETQLVADYFQSRDILAQVEADIGFRKRYATYDADFFSRLEPGASQEDMHDFYNRVVTVTDDGAGLLKLKVNAFTAEDAAAVANATIKAAETMVNQLSEAAQNDAMASARAEVQTAETRLLKASDAVMAYQKRSGDLDPSRTAEAILSVVAGLETELASSRIERAEVTSYLRPGSPTIRALDSKIAALQRQIAIERSRLAANSNETLAEEVQAFERERLQLELSETAFKSALASMEAARLSAQNERSYLVAYVKPSMPDVAAEPNRMYKIATAFAVSLLTFGIGALIVGAVREHARA